MPVPMRGGKLYSTVNERLEAAHGETAQPSGIKSVCTEICPAGQVTVVRATVTFADERVFVGMSEIKFDATSGADKDAPVECAETSAVGRALAFAGYYGSDTGLAGAEEVRTATLRQEHRERGPGTATNGAARVNADLRSQTSPRPAPVVHEPWPQADAPAPLEAAMQPEALDARRRRLIARYDELVTDAKAIGLRPEALPKNADEGTMVRMGTTLRDAIAAQQRANGVPAR